MNVLKLFVISILLLGSGSLMADKHDKVLVCHVGSEGTIDLILVSAKSSHLGNLNHSFGLLTDYQPSEVGATGEGTEDTDGDGIDEGCEPSLCPCWDVDELQAVTTTNQDPGASCYEGGVSLPPYSALIRNTFDDLTEIQANFLAINIEEANFNICAVEFYFADPEMEAVTNVLEISSFEAQTCVQQILTRCDQLLPPAVPE